MSGATVESLVGNDVDGFFVFTFVAVCVWCADSVFLNVFASSSAVGL